MYVYLELIIMYPRWPKQKNTGSIVRSWGLTHTHTHTHIVQVLAETSGILRGPHGTMYGQSIQYRHAQYCEVPCMVNQSSIDMHNTPFLFIYHAHITDLHMHAHTKHRHEIHRRETMLRKAKREFFILMFRKGPTATHTHTHSWGFAWGPIDPPSSTKALKPMQKPHSDTFIKRWIESPASECPQLAPTMPSEEMVTHTDAHTRIHTHTHFSAPLDWKATVEWLSWFQTSLIIGKLCTKKSQCGTLCTIINEFGRKGSSHRH